MKEKLIIDGEKADELLDGSIVILQKEKGYRFSVDALLLAHYVRLRNGAVVVELGAGSAVISVILASRYKDASIIGIEIQPELAEMASRTVVLNGLEERISIREADAGDLEGTVGARTADAAVFNPPYRRLQTGRVNPVLEKAIARHEIKGSLGRFLDGARYVLKDGGSVFIIYPSRRGVELMFAMRARKIEPKRLRMVHSSHESRAEFILVEGVKNGGEELEVMKPLMIYKGPNDYSDEMKEIFKALANPRFVAGSIFPLS